MNLVAPSWDLQPFKKKYTCNDINNQKMHEGMHMACLKSECTGGRENCEKSLKRICTVLRGNREKTEKYKYCSTVPRTIAQDCSYDIFCYSFSLSY